MSREDLDLIDEDRTGTDKEEGYGDPAAEG